MVQATGLESLPLSGDPQASTTAPPNSITAILASEEVLTNIWENRVAWHAGNRPCGTLVHPTNREILNV